MKTNDKINGIKYLVERLLMLANEKEFLLWLRNCGEGPLVWVDRLKDNLEARTFLFWQLERELGYRPAVTINGVRKWAARLGLANRSGEQCFKDFLAVRASSAGVREHTTLSRKSVARN